MAKKEETKFRESCYPFLNGLRNTWWESIQQKAIRGTPDTLLCCNGHFVALEFKTNDGEATPLQKIKLYYIRKAGGYAIEVSPSNWETVKHLLTKLSREGV